MQRSIALLLAFACLSCKPTPKPGAADGGPAGDGGLPADAGQPGDGGFSGDGGRPGVVGPFTTYYGGTGSGSLVGKPATDTLPQAQPANVPYGTIMFVTQVPVSGFTSLTASFGNHMADMQSAPRGGDLYLRYPSGTLRNLTQEAGFGNDGLQSTNAIAVRDPSVHWSGTKALFSMVKGAPAHYATTEYKWQIYEVTNLGLGQTAVITKIPHQPDANNVTPMYGTDDRILFTSSLVPFDVGGPRLDEYETAPTNTGIWSLDRTSGDLKILFNSPSGAFNPIVDSFGRILWTNWDHLQRDQQSDTNEAVESYHPVDCTDEKTKASCTDLVVSSNPGNSPPSIEVFPESREVQADNPDGLSGFTFNQFFPWMMNEDGTGAETLNHVGAQELGSGYRAPSFANDRSMEDSYTTESNHSLHDNRTFLRGFGGLFRLTEDPTHAGRYYWHFAPEFSNANSGELGYVDAAPEVNPNRMKLVVVTGTGLFPGNTAERDGHYRDPLPLTDGKLVASYTSQIQNDNGQVFVDEQAAQALLLENHQPYGGRTAVAAHYDFHLVQLQTATMPYSAGTRLTAGISKSLTWYDPDQLITWSGQLWELQPVEVRARAIPGRRVDPVSTETASVFTQTGVDRTALQNWLIENNLALVTSYNVTQRDEADKQQPFNLQVKNPKTGAIGAKSVVGSATPRDVSYLQFLSGDALRAFRGYGGGSSPVRDGRRVMPEYVAEPRLTNWLGRDGAPAGTTTVAADGSVAAFVPAQKPLTWQLIGPTGKPVVRERYWITFSAGEIRTCVNCHGINEKSQTGALPPANEPDALRDLLNTWKASH